MQTAGARWGCALTMMAGTAAAAPRPAEVFCNDADVIEAVLSPTAKRLAITSGNGTPRIPLVVLDLTPGGRNARAAQFPRADVSGVRWMDDERLVFGAVDLSDGRGREAPRRFHEAPASLPGPAPERRHPMIF